MRLRVLMRLLHLMHLRPTTRFITRAAQAYHIIRYTAGLRQDAENQSSVRG